ncbi:MAG TPA: SDR family oxidoreductase [Candidatus Limnocylindria bacterium]|jgi:3-oxoacyl-[acyl-carrier protein] reductase|nr:SDR family oxidoreductase [Candidatus Limnocylindria bacterium]
MSTSGLKGLVAIISGSSHGIGRGIALRLAGEGCHVIVNGRDEKAIDDVCRSAVGLGVRAIGVRADVSKEEEVERLFQAWSGQFERLDIMVNCAGIWQSTPFHRMTREEWDRVLGVHLQGFFHCSRRAAEIMVGQRSGTIISVSSISDLRAHEKAAAYDAAKGAILAATRAMAVDLGEFGIRVNAVSPGPIYVENWDKFSTPDDRIRAGQQLPLRRIGTPDDVAGVVAFLASADAGFITGQTIYIDGGLTAQARPPSTQPT